MSPELTLHLLSGLVGALLASLLAVGITIANSACDRRRRIKAAVAALRHETEICAAFAREFIKETEDAHKRSFHAPLYRLPGRVYATTFPMLLENAAMKDDDSHAIIRFYNEVDTLNRGLDDVAAKDIHHAFQQIEALNRRNRVKAKRLTGEHPEPDKTDSDLLTPALSALAAPSGLNACIIFAIATVSMALMIAGFVAQFF